MEFLVIILGILIHSFGKTLFKAKKSENQNIVNNANDSLIILRNDVNKNDILKNENMDNSSILSKKNPHL